MHAFTCSGRPSVENACSCLAHSRRLGAAGGSDHAWPPFLIDSPSSAFSGLDVSQPFSAWTPDGQEVLWQVLWRMLENLLVPQHTV